MVFGARFVRLLTKLPVPVPLLVWLPVAIGPEDVPQHTPLAVTVPLPSSVTLPPDAAVVAAIALMAVVVTVGNTTAIVVKVISFPYAVPASFVA